LPSATCSDAVGHADGPPADADADADADALRGLAAELADGVFVTVTVALGEAEEAA
jgi:hypothetical protein